MRKTVYFDASATTPLGKEALRAMLPFLKAEFGNPGSLHSKGFAAAAAVKQARATVARLLNAKPEEIIFTGSGTESTNLAIKGMAENAGKRNHVITTSIEHHAVLDSVEYLRKKGFDVTVVPVEPNGIVDPGKIGAAITPSTFLITAMYANNEIGTLQPVREIAAIARRHGVLFHTDACQAGNSEVLDVAELGVDLMTLNGSKIYGPKGVGCLYKRASVGLSPLHHGGGQEYGIRSGTENVAGIVGFATALQLAQENKINYSSRLTPLRDKLIADLLQIPDSVLNGDPVKRLPNNVNLSFLNVEGESVVLMLDREGICVSTGSACSSASLEPSHVILALGRSAEVAHGSIRLSLPKDATASQVKRVASVMKKTISYLRGISPTRLTLEGDANARR